jgi:hypothetical protein
MWVGQLCQGLISVITDSFSLNKDKNTSGQNISVDYRFYLAKENKFETPHGFYIGPYYSFNHFKRDNQWAFNKRPTETFLNTHSDFYINTLGFEVGVPAGFMEKINDRFCNGRSWLCHL